VKTFLYIAPMTPQFILPGEPASFTCSAKNSDSITIYHNGEEVSDSVSYKEDSASVVMESVTGLDTGSVTCVVRDVEGHYTTRTGYLFVIGEPFIVLHRY